MAIKPITQPLPATAGQIFRDSQSVDVAYAALPQISLRGVMNRVSPTPMIVRRQREHAEQPAERIVRRPGLEEAVMPAIVLQKEQANEHSCGGNCRDGVEPEDAPCRRRVHHYRSDEKRDQGNGEFPDCTGIVPSAIGLENANPIDGGAGESG